MRIFKKNMIIEMNILKMQVERLKENVKELQDTVFTLKEIKKQEEQNEKTRKAAKWLNSYPDEMKGEKS